MKSWDEALPVWETCTIAARVIDLCVFKKMDKIVKTIPPVIHMSSCLWISCIHFIFNVFSTVISESGISLCKV